MELGKLSFNNIVLQDNLPNAILLNATLLQVFDLFVQIFDARLW